ncbi:hypothetical protein NT01CX_0110 [Clostridium novyi NT]|uniref:Uncharacterized protein n=1 Tax=Clostridium novyi (strain NT) TaxID=386415 RepID=A0Q1W7_CLONN|nr:hypothetical protein NT01CX_0110 [Clostridium novyi NT]
MAIHELCTKTFLSDTKYVCQSSTSKLYTFTGLFNISTFILLTSVTFPEYRITLSPTFKLPASTHPSPITQNGCVSVVFISFPSIYKCTILLVSCTNIFLTFFNPFSSVSYS